MKKGFALIAVSLLAFSACQEKIDFDTEMKTIINVIEGETDAYIAEDFDNFASSYVQDETTIWWGAGQTTYWRIDGWSKLGKHFEKDFQDETDPVPYKVEKSNYKIKVYPKSAWVMFDEAMIDGGGEIIWEGFGVRFLEKVDGHWKINYVSTYQF